MKFASHRATGLNENVQFSRICVKMGKFKAKRVQNLAPSSFHVVEVAIHNKSDRMILLTSGKHSGRIVSRWSKTQFLRKFPIDAAIPIYRFCKGLGGIGRGPDKSGGSPSGLFEHKVTIKMILGMGRVQRLWSVSAIWGETIASRCTNNFST